MVLDTVHGFPTFDYSHYTLKAGRRQADTGSVIARMSAGHGGRVADGVVFVGSDDGYLYALDAQSGQERWRFKTEGAAFSSPSLASGLIYVGSLDQNLYALDINTGQEQWRFDTSDRVFSLPAIANHMIFFGSEDGKLYALQ